MTDRRGASAAERADLSATYESYRGSYASRWSLANPGNRAILDERDRLARRLLVSAGLGRTLSGTVLDIGAGSGLSFPGLAADDAVLLRADLLLERLEIGRAGDPDALLVCADGSRLPLPDGVIDLAVLSTVLSSVGDGGLRRSIVAEAWRCLRPGGGILLYDFRVGNPRNHHTGPLRRGDLTGLAPMAPRAVRSLTVAPPLARRLGPATRLYPVLAALPLLRTHYLALWVK